LAGDEEASSKPKPAKGREHWWEFLQRARKELEEAGHRFRTKEEIDAEIEEIRSGDEWLEDVYRQTAKQRRDVSG
jgi:transposase